MDLKPSHNENTERISESNYQNIQSVTLQDAKNHKSIGIYQIFKLMQKIKFLWKFENKFQSYDVTRAWAG